MAELWKTNIDQRQFELMEGLLTRYDEGLTDLGSLIAGLESLLLCLEVVDENWKDAFRKDWGILEEVNAVALDQVEQGATTNVNSILNEPDNQRLIRQGIEGIRSLLAKQVTRM